MRSSGGSRGLLLLAFATAFVVPTAASAAAPVLVSDSFHRTLSGGWGSAGPGRVWRVAGARFSVDGHAGTLSLPANRRSARASLPRLRARDVEARVTVSLARRSRARTALPFVQLRQESGRAYRFWLVARDGRFVSVGVSRVIGPRSVVIAARQLAPAIDVASGVRLHVRAVGSNATALDARVWPTGSREPRHSSLRTHDSTPALQQAGSFGVGVVRRRSGRQAVVRFRSLEVQAPLSPPSPPSPTPVPAPVGDPVFIGAGDIASCTTTRDEQTAHLVDGIPGTVFTVGDNAYPSGTTANFSNCYSPSWGRFRSRTHPAAGNHEYETSSAAAPYFQYFGAAAANPGQGWYAYDLGAWRIYTLNSQCAAVGGCGAGSPQLTWLQADLAANPRACVAAIWHTPRFSSGTNGDFSAMQPFWATLARAGAELVLSGHDHDYERFLPINAGDAPDPQGMRQFVIGTGGAGGGAFRRIHPSSAVRAADAIGVLKLTLHPGSYDFRFVHVPGQTFTDAGSASCH